MPLNGTMFSYIFIGEVAPGRPLVSTNVGVTECPSTLPPPTHHLRQSLRQSFSKALDLSFPCLLEWHPESLKMTVMSMHCVRHPPATSQSHEAGLTPTLEGMDEISWSAAFKGARSMTPTAGVLDGT